MPTNIPENKTQQPKNIKELVESIPEEDYSIVSKAHAHKFNLHIEGESSLGVNTSNYQKFIREYLKKVHGDNYVRHDINRFTSGKSVEPPFVTFTGYVILNK